jgi:hypothetical protein
MFCQLGKLTPLPNPAAVRSKPATRAQTRPAPASALTNEKAAVSGGLFTAEQEGLISNCLSPRKVRSRSSSPYPPDPPPRRSGPLASPAVKSNVPEAGRLLQVLILAMHTYFSGRCSLATPEQIENQTTNLQKTICPKNTHFIRVNNHNCVAQISWCYATTIAVYGVSATTTLDREPQQTPLQPPLGLFIFGPPTRRRGRAEGGGSPN